MEYIEYKTGKKGHIPKEVPSFDKKTRAYYQEMSEGDFAAFRTAGLTTSRLLSIEFLSLDLEQIRDDLTEMGITFSIDGPLFYEEAPLTLYYYLQVRGDLEDNTELAALGLRLRSILHIAWKYVCNVSLTPEESYGLLIAGRKVGSLTHYSAINREEPFVTSNEEKAKKSEETRVIIREKNDRFLSQYPNATQKQQIENLENDPDVGLKYDAIKKHLREIAKGDKLKALK
ncbi:hypothetical protein AB4302_08385 [Vibrio breoganii]